MTAKRNLPDPTDKAALRAWMAARRTETSHRPAPRTMAEFQSRQMKKLARAVQDDSLYPDTPQDIDRPVLKFALNGRTVRNHYAETSVLGEWLHTLQTTVQSVAYALDDLRQVREAGPVPGEIKRATRLFSGPVFASSYGMVLQGAPSSGQAELPGNGTELLLDKAINRIFDVTDGASSESAEEAVLDVVLPLGRRAIKQLSSLSHVLASTGTDVTLTWESKTTSHRTSTFTSASAARCHKALQDARIEDASERIIGLLVGGSKSRGFIELEVEGRGMVVVRTNKEDVTGILATHTERIVQADVHVLIARSPGGREHRSYVMINLQDRRGDGMSD